MILPLASVIVPVYKNVGGLRPLLQALKRQTYPKDLFEIIIVNNDPCAKFSDIKNEYNFVRIVIEDKEGSYAARNKGIEAARGEILAFTDADCVPARDWLENGVNSLKNINNKGMIAGHVEVTFLDSLNPNSCELYDALCSFQQKNFLKQKRFGVTANLFTSKTTMKKVGLFDSRLKSGGDCEWGNRLFHQGLIQIYSAKTVVKHPSRRSLRTLIGRSLRVTAGTMVTHEKYNYTEKSKREYILQHILKRPANIIKKMNHMQLGVSPMKKFWVVGIYFLIKVFQLLERIRIRLGGKYRR